MPSKSNFDINFKQKGKFISYFIEAMNLFTPELQLKNENIQKERDLVFILSGMTKVSGTPISFRLIRGIVEGGLRKCKKDNITDPEQIVEVLRKIYQKRKTRPIKKFTIVASLHLEKNVIPKKSGKFFNYPFSVFGYYTLIKKYKVKRYINPSFEKMKTMSNFLMLSPTEKKDMQKSNYIEVKIESEDKDSAFRKAWQIIELFRSIINYSASFGTYRLLGQHNPFSIVLPSTYIFVFDKNHDLASYWYTRSLHEKNMKMIKTKKIEKTKNGFIFLVKKMEKINNDKLRNILFNAILRHGKGLDELASGTAFISFWQSFEFISLKHFFNFSEKDVCSRIKSLLHDEKLKDKVDILYARRNYFVHQGEISDYDLHDLNAVKEISELVIAELFQHIPTLTDVDELNLFYKYTSQNNVELRKIDKVIKYVTKHRGQ